MFWKAFPLVPVFFVALFLFFVAPSHAQASLVGYWSLDSSDIDWDTGVVTDLSGSGNDGVVHNLTSSSQVAGQVGGALQFNDTNAYISIPSTASFPPSGDHARTVCLWLKPTTNSWTPDVNTLFEYGTSGTRTAYAIDMDNFPNMQFYTWGDDLLAAMGITGHETDWLQVCYVYDGATMLSLYSNGVLRDTHSLGGHLNTTKTDVSIGRTAILDNYFDGIIDEVRIYDTAFTGDQIETLYSEATDTTPPSISAVATSTTSSGATITWSTDEAASTKLAYSPDTSYTSFTSETDTGTRVTSHSKALSGLLSCTGYNFKVVSADAAGNYATSTAGSFTTTGCPGGATPSSATSTAVTVASAATSTITDSGRTLTVATPANFTATSSSVVIQIKGLPSDTVLGSIGKPNSLSSAASVVFDVTALIDNTTTLDSFDSPVTITYHYTDADVEGLDETTLAMYHYHGGTWLSLDDCTVDPAANTITCSAPSFSTFAIFGSAPASSQSASASHSSISIQQRVANLLAMGKAAEAAALKTAWYWLFPPTTSATPMSVRDLTLGMTGGDVLALQKFLNAQGYILAASGPGSPGGETQMFGALTKAALAKYQAAHSIAPTAGYFGPLTRAKIKALGVGDVWW